MISKQVNGHGTGQAERTSLAVNVLFLTMALCVAYGLKSYYSKATAEELDWILRPTALLVQYLSGLDFTAQAGHGFVNFKKNVVIAPACSGVNFLIIAFSLCTFSFLHRIQSLGNKTLWFFSSLGITYLLTLVVNTFRIILSLHLFEADIYSGIITVERVHRIEGIGVYFLSICTLYSTVNRFFDAFARNTVGSCTFQSTTGVTHRLSCKYLIPLFWYVLIVLAVPLLNGAYHRQGYHFIEHCAWVVGICLFLPLFLATIGLVARKVIGILIR